MAKKMTPDEYQRQAERTESSNFHSDSDRCHRLIHAAIGIQTEAGEFADPIKKFVFYGQNIDLINLSEEIGDLLWYVALACNTLGIHMSDVMETNILKLQKRFPDKFTSEDALEENRDREAEREILEQQPTTTKTTCNYCKGTGKNKVNGCTYSPCIHCSPEVSSKPTEADINHRENIEFQFKREIGIPECTCKILDFDRPNPTMKFNRECPIHKPDMTRLESLCVKKHQTNQYNAGWDCAQNLAEMMDGQDRTNALKMIERAKANAGSNQ